MSRDLLDEMIEELGRRRHPNTPLYLTAIRILRERERKLDRHTMDALEFTGWKAVYDARAYPAEVPVPDTLKRIENGETFDVETFDCHLFDAQERSKLATIGFLTLAGERLMQAEDEN